MAHVGKPIDPRSGYSRLLPRLPERPFWVVPRGLASLNMRVKTSLFDMQNRDKNSNMTNLRDFASQPSSTLAHLLIMISTDVGVHSKAYRGYE
ncbi:hypothetical protein J1614_004569 [Plenodomus biglobosus]|nr:hypothetical protein J1614_004569 [Plenodomus biglobosus]